MSLAAWVPLSDTVSVPAADGPVEIRLFGLSADSIAFLAADNEKTVGALYAALIAGELTRDNLPEIIATLASEAPIFVANVIAFGAQEPDQQEQAARLPIGVQVEAVEKIFALTFAGDFPLKKSREIVAKAVKAMSYLLTSEDGSEKSES